MAALFEAISSNVLGVGVYTIGVNSDISGGVSSV